MAQGRPAAEREYLPLTSEVLTAHLSGEIEVGLYPMLDGVRCWWLAADFDGPAAMLDALAHLKAARAVGAPAALEVSRSGTGAHAWLFFNARSRPRPRGRSAGQPAGPHGGGGIRVVFVGLTASGSTGPLVPDLLAHMMHLVVGGF